MIFTNIKEINKELEVLNKKNTTTIFKLIYTIFWAFIDKVQIYGLDEIYITINPKFLSVVMKCLKTSMLFKFNSLMDISAIDWIWKPHRFTLFYNLLSYRYNFRFYIVLDILVTKTQIFGEGVESVHLIYPSAVWLEREIWDLFGIYFYNHPDLRRILTDYGFVGFPFRKDYPLTGYTEIRYDDTQKIIVFDSLKMSQEFRVFAFINPWIENK